MQVLQVVRQRPYFPLVSVSLVYVERLFFTMHETSLYLVAECKQVDVTHSIHSLDDDVRKTALNAKTLAAAKR